jgi:hypothetical protein
LIHFVLYQGETGIIVQLQSSFALTWERFLEDGEATQQSSSLAGKEASFISSMSTAAVEAIIAATVTASFAHGITDLY